MMIALAIFGLIIFFYLLSLAADFVVGNSSKIAEEFSLPLPLIGLLLGILTTLPELSLGISSLEHGVPAMSAGNLLGGIFVILSLVLGLNIISNREIETDGNWHSLIPLAVYLLLPAGLSLDGSFQYFDAIIMIVGYLVWLAVSYFPKSRGLKISLLAINKKSLAKQVFFIITGGIAILVFSDIIVSLSLFLLKSFNIYPFLVGVLVFSIGTNLPEISIALTSARKKAGSLSFSHLSGSAAANVLCLGLISLGGNMVIGAGRGAASWAYGGILLLLLLFLFYSYDSGKKFSRVEGWFLLVFYAVFATLQIFLVGQL